MIKIVTKTNGNHKDGFIILKKEFYASDCSNYFFFPSNIELNWLFNKVNTINS